MRDLAKLIQQSLRDGVEFCSGLVDLVICVGGYLGVAHCLALAGERFVGLVAEDLAVIVRSILSSPAL
jgi:hypothetical protein